MNGFWNREQELSRIKSFIGKGVLGYVTGRRRIGKTAILVKACGENDGLYHQAIEASPSQQILHIVDEFRERLPIFRDITPKTWGEFFGLLSREKLPRLIVFDEFPYLVATDPALPSILQKWVDHELPKKRTLFMVSGSSQSMLFSQFLRQSSPLYGRANFHIHLPPLPYNWFCRAMKYDQENPESFEIYSLVGGVPHYWKLMQRGNLIEQADYLYFQPSAILAEEPKNLFQDEGVTGTLPKAILDLIGKGVTKPSELASRIGVVQGNLSRPLALLLELGLVRRELPFGESTRTTKKVLYAINDPVVSFYYGTFLPLRAKWQNLTAREKRENIGLHAARQWEDYCRQSYPGSSRYWEGDIEIDMVAYQNATKKHLVAECKWQTLTEVKKNAIMNNLRERFLQTTLSKKLKTIDFKVFSKEDLYLLPPNTSVITTPSQRFTG